MNPRERHLATLLFQAPDRVPFSPGGPRESTRNAWHTQGLPEGANWYQQMIEEVGIKQESHRGGPGIGIDFLMRPQFEEKTIERKANSLVVQDWKGNICEISDKFDVSYLRHAKDFCTRRWIKCPVESWDDWAAMKKRYDADDSGRFPENFDQVCKQLVDREHVVGVSFSGPFWQLREWMGFEGLCMTFVEDPGLIEDMVAFWTDFVYRLLEKVLDGVCVDQVLVNEDMAYKEKAMISPAMTRQYLFPAWKCWGDLLKDAGVPIYNVDSDGYVGELIPIWIDAGFKVNCPQEVAAGNDLPAYRKQFGKSIAYTGGIDKRAMAKGGRVIRAEIERLAPVVRDGGYIPGCDHGIPADVSWPCMLEYARLLAELTGWL